MGNAQARQRLKFRDFEYLAKFTGIANAELMEEYFDEIMDKNKDGKMDPADFKKTFNFAFPNKPVDKLDRLADEITDSKGKISMANMMILFYMFCSGKTETNLEGMFNLFDKDGNKQICMDELFEMMGEFIHIAEGKENAVDLAKTMAEMFKVADKNKDEVLSLKEFQQGMMEHPLTSKILREKTLDALLEAM